MEPDGDGAIVRIDVSQRAALVSAVLPYGAAVEVLAPADLRAEVAGIYDELSRRYAATKKAKR